jgi:N6-L-threonylcarbamoyladenine synthase
LADICASFQEAAVDTLISQTKRGMIKTGISTVVIAGGVAANTRLRTKSRSFDAHIPSFSLCTDNAAMIAARGYHDLKGASAAENDLSLNAQASCASILSYRA